MSSDEYRFTISRPDLYAGEIRSKTMAKEKSAGILTPNQMRAKATAEVVKGLGNAVKRMTGFEKVIDRDAKMSNRLRGFMYEPDGPGSNFSEVGEDGLVALIRHEYSVFASMLDVIAESKGWEKEDKNRLPRSKNALALSLLTGPINQRYLKFNAYMDLADRYGAERKRRIIRQREATQRELDKASAPLNKPS